MLKTIRESQEKVEDMYNKILKKIEFMCEKNANKIPYTLLPDGTYNDLDYIDENPDLGVNWWTNGFFAGVLWQMYHATRDEKYLEMARDQEKRLDQCFELFEGIHHDAGFMWLLSAAADFEITGNEQARIRGMHAATILAGRYNINGNFIRAWNGYKGSDLNSVIIDSLMNMSLLHWASEVSKDPRFKAIAVAHTDTVAKYFVREDGSVNHIIRFDAQNGEKIEELGGQGYATGSAWARGQAWALYGFSNAYKHIGQEKYLQKAKETADFFIAHIRENTMVQVDFCQPKEDMSEDNSAVCIAASGFITLSELVAEEERETYLEAAWRLLEMVYERRSCLDTTQEALVQRCAVSYKERTDGPQTLIYADYFCLEAILKLRQKALNIW